MPRPKTPLTPEILFLSFLGIGFLPKAPGTWASLAAVPLLYGVAVVNPPIPLLIPILVLAVVGAGLTAQVIQKRLGLHDPGWIVIDEVIGMFVAFLFCPHAHWGGLLILFALFRFFDIVKVWPATYFDRSVPHGIGTILDDVVAGIYAGIVCFLGHSLLF
ncbi:MAG: phosphatidylglycerophosphatase A [Bacteriovoracales bacterium]|nr:phosphatidylglycerophosphatase A [Bacteriovoracales bacterium]